MLDFLLTWVLVEVFNCWFLAANIAGNICGAAAQFLLSKYWVFTMSTKPTRIQLLKFIVMWALNIVLSGAGVYLLANFAGLHYLLSKLLVSVSLGVSYTYFVSKKVVFV